MSSIDYLSGVSPTLPNHWAKNKGTNWLETDNWNQIQMTAGMISTGFEQQALEPVCSSGVNRE
jgi:hypothetical protein